MAPLIDERDYKPEVLDLLHQPWTIEIRPYNDGGYFARVVELRGCMTEGDTKLEALKQLEEAQAEWLAAALESGDPIPRPLGDTEFSGKIFVRTSPHLHRMVTEAALREGVSMSQWIAEVLSRAVSFQEARLWFTQGDAFRELLDALRGVTTPSTTAKHEKPAVSEGTAVLDAPASLVANEQTSESEGARGRRILISQTAGGTWAVKKSGAKRASSVHATKSEAIKAARKAVRQDQSDLVIEDAE